MYDIFSLIAPFDDWFSFFSCPVTNILIQSILSTVSQPCQASGVGEEKVQDLHFSTLPLHIYVSDYSVLRQGRKS